MQNQTTQVFLGTRIPLEVKEKLAEYCVSHGVKINFLVTEAIREKLRDIQEERVDLEMARERLKDAAYVSQKEFDRYLTKRAIKP